MHSAAAVMREAVEVLDRRKVDFEYDGEMAADVALEPELRALYPFCRLTGPANILIMPGLHSAHIASRLAPRVGGGSTIGPLLIGMNKAANVLQENASTQDIVNLAAVTALRAQREEFLF